MGLQFSITAIGSIMLQSANNALGTACVAAFTSAMRIKMFFICPFESLGIAMATYCGQNYGAGKPKRIWQGIKASGVMMLIYALLTFVVLMVGARTLALLFVDTTELEILKNTELFLHVSAYFFPFLGLLCILRYTIQGAGYTNLAMLSGVSEMIARYPGQHICRTGIRLYCSLFRRSDSLAGSRSLSDSSLYLCLPEIERAQMSVDGRLKG